MRYGDISNRVAPKFLIRVDGNLLKYKKPKGIINYIRDKLKPKYDGAEVNKNLAFIINHLAKNTDYTFDLVILDRYYEDGLKEYLNTFISYSDLNTFNNIEEIRNYMDCGVYIYYVDNEVYTQPIPNKITGEKLYNLVKGGFIYV